MSSKHSPINRFVHRAVALCVSALALCGCGGPPRDTTDHPKGVWTLPPTYALGDVDRAKDAAIGESDRMTLRFVKP